MVSIGDPNLPQDLLINIVSSLPVKSILRCKCVCKDWYSLIQTPHFINTHFHNRNNRNRPLVYHIVKLQQNRNADSSYIPGKSILTYFPFDVFAQHDVHQVAVTPEIYTYFDLIGPVNGVFLVIFFPKDPSSGIVALWNPATKVFKVLPLPELKYQPDLRWGGFNLGFGCEPTTNNYKVVRIHFPLCKAKAVTLAVYSLKTNSWRQIHISSPKLIYSISCIVSKDRGSVSICGRRVGTYFDGAYYWLSRDATHKNSLEIVVFDMEEEVFRVIPAPPSFDPDKHSCRDDKLELMLQRDNLALLVWRSDGLVMTCIDIWLMEREGLWTQHIVLKLRLETAARPLAFWGDGMSLIFQTWDRNLLLYNPDGTTNRGCEVIQIGNFESSAIMFKIFNYKESIVPIISQGCTSPRWCSGSITFSFIAEKLAKICQLSFFRVIPVE